MGFASFSPSLSVLRSGSSGLSTVFAPFQALVAFFVPVQVTQASYRSLVHMPSQRMASKQNTIQHTRTAVHAAAGERPVSRLKVMREFEPGMARSQSGRMVISGRMSDVCAELDRIAQKETARS